MILQKKFFSGCVFKSQLRIHTTENKSDLEIYRALKCMS